MATAEILKEQPFEIQYGDILRRLPCGALLPGDEAVGLMEARF
jgi:hypothetical protein